jgi:hypothetical protein
MAARKAVRKAVKVAVNPEPVTWVNFHRVKQNRIHKETAKVNLPVIRMRVEVIWNLVLKPVLLAKMTLCLTCVMSPHWRKPWSPLKKAWVKQRVKALKVKALKVKALRVKVLKVKALKVKALRVKALRVKALRVKLAASLPMAMDH